LLARDLFELAHQRRRDPTAAKRLVDLDVVDKELRRVAMAAWELMSEDVPDGLMALECDQIQRPFVGQKVDRQCVRQRPLAAQLDDDFLISGA
jgi:hypothetical protein